MNTFRLLLFVVALIGFTALSRISNQIQDTRTVRQQESVNRETTVTEQLVYPNATYISQQAFESSDTLPTIVSWYQKKFSDLGMTIEKAKLTQQQGITTHTLIARKDAMELAVIISRNSTSKDTNIEIRPK